MKNRLEVFLAFVLAMGLTVSARAQETSQTLPSDDTVTLTAEETVKMTGEPDLFKTAEQSSISAFLNSITTQARINFIMSEEFANKKVTASLTKVTVREALDTLLRVHGLTYQRIGKSESYVVTKRSNDAPDTITKIYTLSYISLQGMGSASSEMSSVLPQITNTGSSLGSSSSSNNISTDTSSMNSGSDAYSGQAEIIGIIKSMLSPVGRIAVDARTNKLIVTDVAEVFPQVENILAELDIKPPQILIEAQIVEVNKTSGLNLGFEYGGSDGSIFTFTGPSRKVDYDFIKGNGVHGWNYIFPTSDQLNSDSSGSGSEGGGSSSSSSSEAEDAAGLLDFSAFRIVLRSLLTRGEAKYLGKPKVVTVNNKTATIMTTTQASVGFSTTTGSSGDYTSESTDRANVGLTMQVTPQVNREGYVTLYVQPSYSDLSDGIGNTKDPTTRAVSTLVRVKNGQTVVIGGLLNSRETDSTRKVPLLGDIPLIGWLFTSKEKTKSTTDLVIFITPTILAE